MRTGWPDLLPGVDPAKHWHRTDSCSMAAAFRVGRQNYGQNSKPGRRLQLDKLAKFQFSTAPVGRAPGRGPEGTGNCLRATSLRGGSRGAVPVPAGWDPGPYLQAIFSRMIPTGRAGSELIWIPGSCAFDLILFFLALNWPLTSQLPRLATGRAVIYGYSHRMSCSLSPNCCGAAPSQCVSSSFT